MRDADVLAAARRSVGRGILALQCAQDDLGAEFLSCARLLVACEGLVWVTGVGTSAAVGQRFAHILSCCGARSMFLSPSDGLHGHTAALRPPDLLIALSRGGESAEVIEMTRIAKRVGVTTVAFVHDIESTLARSSDHVLPIQSPPELELMGYLATTSTLAFSAVCDALCAVVAEVKGATPGQLAVVHPGGAVGRELAEKPERPGSSA